MEELFSIQTTSRLSGVRDHTIRAWERRYQALTPRRTVTGRRNYSLEDVERLKLLNTLVKTGYAISEIVSLPDQRLRELAVENSGNGDSPVLKASADFEIDLHLDVVSEIFVRALKSLKGFDLENLNRIFLHARTALSARSFALKVLMPLLTEVGCRVDSGVFTVAHEHGFSEMVRSHLGQMLEQMRFNSIFEEKVLLCTLEGEFHEFGTLIASTLFAANGYVVRYLGPNLPSFDLAKACETIQPDLLIIGTAPAGFEMDWSLLKSYLTDLDSRLPQKVSLWLGGVSPLLEKAIRLPFKRELKTLNSLESLEEEILKRIIKRKGELV